MTVPIRPVLDLWILLSSANNKDTKAFAYLSFCSLSTRFPKNWAELKLSSTCLWGRLSRVIQASIMMPSATALRLVYMGSGRFDSFSSVTAINASFVGLRMVWYVDASGFVALVVISKNFLCSWNPLSTSTACTKALTLASDQRQSTALPIQEWLEPV